MEYLSIQATAQRWLLSLRYVQRLAANGRIPGAKKFGNYWMVPADAVKPLDPRKVRRLSREARMHPLFFYAVDLPKNSPDAALSGIEEAMRPLAMADLAFRRGDPEPAKTVWYETADDDRTKLSVASLAVAAAISSGDYTLYDEIRFFLQSCMKRTKNEADRALLSLPGTLAAVSMAVPDMTPAWLKNCDFSLFSSKLRPFLLFLYAMHLRNVGDYAAMLGVASATLLLTQKDATFTWLTVYLGVLCAVAAYALGDYAQSKRYLDDALALATPYGFLAPFADHLGGLGGTLETTVAQKYSVYSKPLLALWEDAFKNWMRFHNAFSKANITTILNAQEYHVARLLALGETYAGASRRLNLSVGRVKNLQSAVYGKLHIVKKSELGQYIL